MKSSNCSSHVFQINSLQALEAQILNKWVCPEPDLKITADSASPEDDPVPDWVVKSVGPALGTLVTTRQLGADRNKIPDDFVTGMGTGFAVKSSSGATWLSAAHVTRKVNVGDRMIVMRPGEEYVKWNPDGASGKLMFEKFTQKSGEVEPQAYSEPALNSYDGKRGFDFAQFRNDGVNYSSDSQRSEVQPLSVRDLQRNPLAMNEPLYLVGLQFGKIKAFSCANRGYDKDTFEADNNINFFAKCGQVKVGADGGVPLGGISGGVVVDKNGNAVGVFNGYSFPNSNPTKLSIRAVPIYQDPSLTGHFQPYPPLSANSGEVRCFPCYDHTAADPVDTFVADPNAGKSICAVSEVDKQRLRFMTKGQ